uniref:Olfactory receptor n=1 Tax=Xenopus tropicalis TaxID=8364 RepID=A0A1B8Y4M7_XENTR
MATIDTNNSFSHTEFILLGFPGISQSRHWLFIPFFFIYLEILMGNFMIMYRIWVEKSLHFPMYSLICLLFAVNISCTTAIVPNMLMGLAFGLDHISLGSCLFQMFFIYTAVILESTVLMIMALDRYLAICRPLRYHNIMNNRLVGQLFLIGLVQSSLFSSSIIIAVSQVQFCRSNIIWNFACENMVLLNLGCGDISKIQVVGLMVRVLVTAMGISLLLVSYLYIFHSAWRITRGKALHKTLHTCSTHLIVVVLNYSCGLSSSILYRMPVSVDVQNLFSAIYYLFPATIHPIIYGYRMKEIRMCLVKSLKINR